jgi:hypothetical protein
VIEPTDEMEAAYLAGTGSPNWKLPPGHRAGLSAALALVERDYAKHLVEAINTLELVGCQFWACEGETLEPIDMVTCHRCASLARLRHLTSAEGPS